MLCQEVGHTLGLDHQDEDIGNAPLGTCMDCSNDPNPNQHPNQHDYNQLETIYAHLDSTTTVAQPPPAMNQIAVEERWPRAAGGGRFAVLTGGEPLQLDDVLAAQLHARGFELAVGTNGSLEVPAAVDCICVSQRRALVQRTGEQLKLVFPQRGAEPEQVRGHRPLRRCDAAPPRSPRAGGRHRPRPCGRGRLPPSATARSRPGR